MKDIRQGNDIRISWSIFKKDGQIFSLEGKNISLYLKSVFGRKELNDFVVTGNIIQWTFYGKDQKNTGKYSLEMVINEGEKGMITTDKCDFVNLVSCSCKLQGGEDAPNVETESIELTSTLEYVSGGGAYDDTALWRALNGKVDKVEGKGLSSNDFTNALKEKLEGLENYDDAEISSAVEKLSRDFNSLLGNNASAAIESFNEIIAFLEGIEDSASLDAIVASIQQEIAKVSNGLADTDAKLTELSAEVSGLSERVEELGEGGAQEILKVEYGKTTFQEIKDAYVAGKYIVFEYANNVFHINRVDVNDIYFVSINGALAYRVGLNNKNNWYQNVYANEQSTNKTTSLSESSTDTQYPSAKAVYDAIQQSGSGGGMTTPSGDPMHYMFEIVGAVWNGTGTDITKTGVYGDSYTHKAGCWCLNEVGDLTNVEMRQIYLYANLDNGAKGVTKYLAGIETRTNIATWSSSWNGKIKDQEAFAYAYNVIVARMRNKEHYIDTNASFTFTGCTALQKILPTLDATSTTTFNGIFDNCNNLREVRIKNVKVAIKFNASPLISKASILYLIQNSAATSAMVITLHADAYARLAEDADIVAALAEKTNVSLAK